MANPKVSKSEEATNPGVTPTTADKISEILKIVTEIRNILLRLEKAKFNE